MGRTDEVQAEGMPENLAADQLKPAPGPSQIQSKMKEGGASPIHTEKTASAQAAVTETQTHETQAIPQPGDKRKGDVVAVESTVQHAVTRLDDGTMNEQESLQSMRESNAPHTGEELYKDAVHPEAPQHGHATAPLSEKTKAVSPSAAPVIEHAVTRLDDGTINEQESLQSMRESNAPHTGEELYKDAVHPEAPQHGHSAQPAHEGAKEEPPSKRPKSVSPTAVDAEITKPVTRLDDGTLDKQESLNAMRATNAPHTGEELYEDAVPAAEGGVKKPSGRRSKRTTRRS